MLFHKLLRSEKRKIFNQKYINIMNICYLLFSNKYCICECSERKILLNIGRSIIIQGNIKMGVNRLNQVQKATYL